MTIDELQYSLNPIVDCVFRFVRLLAPNSQHRPKWTRMSYVPKHSRVHDDSEYVCIIPHLMFVTDFVGNKQTFKHSTLYISTDYANWCILHVLVFQHSLIITGYTVCHIRSIKLNSSSSSL